MALPGNESCAGLGLRLWPRIFIYVPYTPPTKQSSRHGQSRSSHYAHFDAKHQQNIVILLNFPFRKDGQQAALSTK